MVETPPEAQLEFFDGCACYESTEINSWLKSKRIVSTPIGFDSKRHPSAPYTLTLSQTVLAINLHLLKSPADSTVEAIHSAHKNCAKFKVFQELYGKEYYVTEGVKYGSDFLLYEDDPSKCHAKYMVFIIEGDDVKVNHLVTYERIAESNKKTAILCWIKGGDLNFSTISQFNLIND